MVSLCFIGAYCCPLPGFNQADESQVPLAFTLNHVHVSHSSCWIPGVAEEWCHPSLYIQSRHITCSKALLGTGVPPAVQEGTRKHLSAHSAAHLLMAGLLGPLLKRRHL